jgi:hypothetical protein
MEMLMIYEWDAERLAERRIRKIGASVTLLAVASAAWLLFY